MDAIRPMYELAVEILIWVCHCEVAEVVAQIEHVVAVDVGELDVSTDDLDELFDVGVASDAPLFPLVVGFGLQRGGVDPFKLVDQLREHDGGLGHGAHHGGGDLRRWFCRDDVQPVVEALSRQLPHLVVREVGDCVTLGDIDVSRKRYGRRRVAACEAVFPLRDEQGLELRRSGAGADAARIIGDPDAGRLVDPLARIDGPGAVRDATDVVPVAAALVQVPQPHPRGPSRRDVGSSVGSNW
ncbi:hypothetical protein [Hyphomicrobium sp. NDB2Meth4]|uniref:hypothetical protein n=1 Tax=Hyphomicrobium sp. NDB2Meth4 TaxID=1892846 RepID=UPI001114F208|nr:hypothetical protein [Hyphomicrobium sp. NDB2Meth4]